jgi:hypothetical protein
MMHCKVVSKISEMRESKVVERDKLRRPVSFYKKEVTLSITVQR